MPQIKRLTTQENTAYKHSLTTKTLVNYSTVLTTLNTSTSSIPTDESTLTAETIDVLTKSTIPAAQLIEKRALVGTTVRLVCTDYDADMPINWYKLGANNQYKRVAEFNSTSEIMIENISMNHSGIYKCVLRVNNSDMSWQEATSIRLTIIDHDKKETSDSEFATTKSSTRLPAQGNHIIYI